MLARILQCSLEIHKDEAILKLFKSYVNHSKYVECLKRVIITLKSKILRFGKSFIFVKQCFCNLLFCRSATLRVRLMRNMSVDIVSGVRRDGWGEDEHTLLFSGVWSSHHPRGVPPLNFCYLEHEFGQKLKSL